MQPNNTAAGTPAWLRTRNDREALRLFLENGPLTRRQLGELSGLSKPTAAQMIRRLEKVGLILPIGEASGLRGPNAVTYGVQMDRLTGVALAIFNDESIARVVDAGDREHPVVSVPHPPGKRTPEGDVRAAVSAACAAAGVDSESVGIVAVGVQAAFDDATDYLRLFDTLPGWPAQGSLRRLTQQLGMEVWIDNDANLAATGERASGVARGVHAFTMLWVGDGVGVGVDIGGVIHRGAGGAAGELGYLEVPRSAETVAPGARTLTDLMGSGAVLQLLGGPPDARLADWLGRLTEDESAMEALAHRIAIGVTPIIALLDPDLVVLGGPTGTAGGARLAELVQRRIDESSDVRPRVAASELGHYGVLRGARRMLVQHIRDRLEAQIQA